MTKGKLTTARMHGHNGQESCLRAGESDCKIVGNGTRFYGEDVEFGFSGFRGPFCSAKCYRTMYPIEEQ